MSDTMTEMSQQDRTKALYLINEARAIMGQPALAKLPNGFFAGTTCVVGRSLGMMCGASHILAPEKYSERIAFVWGTKTQTNMFSHELSVELPDELFAIASDVDGKRVPDLWVDDPDELEDLEFVQT